MLFSEWLNKIIVIMDIVRPLPVWPLALLAATQLAACTPGCDIIAAGTFEHVDNPRLKASLESTVGLFPNLAAYPLVAETDEIEARSGAGFGFLYALTGFFDHKDLTATVLHPVIRKQDGATSSSLTVPWKTERDSITWWFDSPEKMVPGDWSLRVEHEGRALCQKTFSVRLRYL